MNDDVRKSLSDLHEKQDAQTEQINAVRIALGKQEVALDSYVKQSDRFAAELQEMNKNMSIYNAELKVHIAGVVELKEQNRLMREEIRQRDFMIDNRLKIAEKPIEWARATGKVLAWVGGIATAVTAIGGCVAWLLGLI